MTVEETYIKLRDELTADNESSSSPERIFIKNDEQTICTLGMNRSHEIIFVEFKPAPKDLHDIEREGFVHPHPVEMLHDAGWRQAQITSWEEAEKLLEIINRSYKKKKPKPEIAAAKKLVKIPLLKKPPSAAMASRMSSSAARMATVAPTKSGKPMKGVRPPEILSKSKPAEKAKPVPKPKMKSAPKPKAAVKVKKKAVAKIKAKPKVSRPKSKK
ncbi:hypothetical protein L0244_26500 [bacterium]|nr:hypothetical protein [bacterium]